MNTTLTKIWINEFKCYKTIRLDFSNDRHYEAIIEQYPNQGEQVAKALFGLAGMIASDINVKKET